MSFPSLLLCCGVLVGAPPSTPAPLGSSPSESEVIQATLAQSSIEATSSGALQWLGEMVSDGPSLRRLNDDLAALASEEYDEREQATRRLELAPFVPPRLLDGAIQGADAEQRWRAQRVRELSENRQASVLDAVVRQIAQAPPRGAVLLLVDALPLARHSETQELVLQEVRRLAGPGDVGELKRRLATRDVQVRRAATAGLLAAASLDSLDEYASLLTDEQDEVAL